MKLLVLNGSPRNDSSNTLQITKAFLKGFPDDTRVETVNINELEIKPCQGCFSCWGATLGRCVIRDDMLALLGKIKEAELIIQSFPLYFYGLPSGLKAMIDRCLPLMKPYMGDIAESGTFHKLEDLSMLKKKLLLISSCGYVSTEGMYDAVLKQYDHICGEGRYQYLFFPEGEIFIAPNVKRQRNAFLDDMAKAGSEYAENGHLSPETIKRITKPMLSPMGFHKLTADHRRKFGIEE